MFPSIVFLLATSTQVLRSDEPKEENGVNLAAREETIRTLVEFARTSGSSEEGFQVYIDAKSACFSCHRIGQAGGMIGPELTKIGQHRSPEQLAESLLWPNAKIEKEFQVHKFLLDDASVVVGYVDHANSNAQQIVVIEPSTLKTQSMEVDSIELQSTSPSLMPDGLVSGLDHASQADLLRFLMSLNEVEQIDIAVLESKIKKASTHAPTSFPYEARPLELERHPDWQAAVNRDRVYDFYRKQARYFKVHDPNATWLEEFPGLDGKEHGHWGNQSEETWRSDAWNKATKNRVQCNVLRVGSQQISRAICVRLSDAVSICFNPDRLAYELAWKGGFVRFSDVRHGYMGGVEPDGEVIELPKDAGPAIETLGLPAGVAWQYLGYRLENDRVLFEYAIDGIDYVDEMVISQGLLHRKIDKKNLRSSAEPRQIGEASWPDTIETPIVLGEGRGLVIDTIELPQNNPWNTTIACGDLGFMSDGSIIVATMEGDVFRVALSDDRATWRRIASGLHHALGVCVDQDQIYVLGRNQITRLHDTNGDLEADFYECFSNAFSTSPGGHDYICGLQRDAAGCFYTASGNQGLVKISADGKTATVLATGFRNPDGLGLLPYGSVTVPCSEGDWTPASMICLIEPMPNIMDRQATVQQEDLIPFFGYRGPKPGQTVELPLVYLPRGVDNSSGGQVFIQDERLGPLNHQLVHTSFGSGTAMMILRDRVNGRWQGAAVPLPGEFKSGAHRARVCPKDGMLYVCGMQGWGTYTTQAGCLQRIRYTGDSIQLPTGFHVHTNGVWLDFPEPIDAITATNLSNHFAQAWNYRYSPGYGSKEYSVKHPLAVGHDRLEIRAAYLGPQNQSLFLEIPSIQRCNQLHLQVQTNPGVEHDIYMTVHELDSPEQSLPDIQALQEKELLPHPLVRDLEWLQKRIANPWQNKLPDARVVELNTKDNLQFEQRVLIGKAGETIELRLKNPDSVPHNWVLVKPGTLEKVGELANRLVNDPDAHLRHYVPESDHVIGYTDMVVPGSESSIFLRLPSTAGRYPFLCTFPGHWMVMNGEFVIEY